MFIISLVTIHRYHILAFLCTAGSFSLSPPGWNVGVGGWSLSAGVVVGVVVAAGGGGGVFLDRPPPDISQVRLGPCPQRSLIADYASPPKYIFGKRPQRACVALSPRLSRKTKPPRAGLAPPYPDTWYLVLAIFNLKVAGEACRCIVSRAGDVLTPICPSGVYSYTPPAHSRSLFNVAEDGSGFP